MSLTKEQISKTLADLDKIISQVQQTLGPVLNRPLSEVTKDLDPIENAKLQVTLAYTMNSLYFRTSVFLLCKRDLMLLVCMRLQNANLVGHDILDDMERLKAYLGKVQDAVDAKNETGPNIKLNKEAAKRFVKSALWEVKEQKPATGINSNATE